MGYKLHLDVACCGVPITAALTSASVHDNQLSVPLARLSAQRVTSLYVLMDAAYDSDARTLQLPASKDETTGTW